MRAVLARLAFVGVALVVACGDEDGGPSGAGAASSTGTAGGAGAPSCAEGWADCNGDAADGCETSLQSSSGHCGACGSSCDGRPHALVAMCADAACVMVGCMPGWEDCNVDPEDGCETDVTSDDAHCGVCHCACSTSSAPHTTSGACVANACALECEAGWGDCDGTAPGCETDLAATDSSCGACGHDCGPGGCDAGACKAVAIVSAAGEPFDLALDDGELYWADTTGSIRRVDLTTLATDVVWDGEVTPGSLALSEDSVFWSTWSPENAIRRGKRDKTGSPETLCGPQMVDSQNPMGLSWDGTFLVWVDFGAAPNGQFGIHAWASDPSPICVTIHQDVIPFVDAVFTPFSTWFWTQVDPATAIGTVKTGPLPVPTYVADATTTDADGPAFVAMDATHVYWTTLAGKVKRAPIDAMDAVETIWESISPDEPTTFGIAVDTKFVYFAADTLGGPVEGKIYRLRKP